MACSLLSLFLRSRPVAALLLLALAGPGCAGRSVLAPKSPFSSRSGLRSDLLAAEQIGYWRGQYELYEGTALSREGNVVRAHGNPQPAQAKLYRNKIIHQLLVIDDDFFLLWAQRLHGTKSLGSGLGDAATTILSAFAAASGPASAKSISLAISAITGVRVSAEKNIFLEQSVGALIAQMEKDRANIDTQIRQYLARPVSEYPLEDGLRDVMRYYQAGTLAAAGQNLLTDTTVRERQATAVREVAKGDRTIAPRVLASSEAPAIANGPPPPAKSPRPSSDGISHGLNTARRSKAATGQQRAVASWVLAHEQARDFEPLRAFLVSCHVTGADKMSAPQLAEAARDLLAGAANDAVMDSLYNAAGRPSAPAPRGAAVEPPPPISDRPDANDVAGGLLNGHPAPAAGGAPPASPKPDAQGVNGHLR